MSSDRLCALEERLAWLEKHIGEQDRVILQQVEELERVRKALLALKEQLAPGGEPPFEDPVLPQERPPHY